MIIQNGKIHVGNGQVLEGYDILINNGIIEKIGQNLDEENRQVIDGSNREIFPGFIDPSSSYGCIDNTFPEKDHNEVSNPITPEAKIKYSFSHKEIMDEELYKIGITTIGATPGNKNIIGGQMAVFKTWGSNANKMLVKEPVGLKGSVIKAVKDTYGKRNICPMTKMGIFSELEKLLDESSRSLKSTKDSESNEKNIIMEKILKKELSLFITANSTAEINSVINLISQYDIDLVLIGGYQADRCINSIVNINASIIVGEQGDLNAKSYNNTDLYKIGKLQEKGNLVSFTLTSDGGPQGKINYLWNAIGFYKAGIPSEDVLSMMTINPAKILGVDDILGTIEEGKQADLVIYSNNPIEYYNSKVIYTIIEGKIAHSEGGEKYAFS